MYTVSHERVENKHIEITARGIVDVVSIGPFRLWVTSFSWGTLIITKGMVLSRGAGVPGRLVQVSPTFAEKKDTPRADLYTEN